ncbi:MAG: FAD-dependent oxidoreductase [Phycisphaerae bacterium]|nr:FAD-dependent oxidoreductase [Phycisphaerae bacterium]NNF41691.1 NAD(P)-binding protein [Phycisphaerales bacterium]
MSSVADSPATGARRPRLAIVGSGIAGLVCAHRLKTRYDLTLFEAATRPGGHTHTVDVERDGERFAIDTGFIVFNPVNYPLFTALLDELNVPSQPTTMSFSVRCDRTGLEYNGTSLNRLFAQRRNVLRPRFLGMVRDILRFARDARVTLAAGDEDETVDAFVRRHGYGVAFVEHYLVPLGASLWSAPGPSFRRFPIRFVARFLENHRMLDVGGRPQWRTVTGGSRRYVDAIVNGLGERVRLGTPVRHARRRVDRVELETGDGDRGSFDHVIFACHADQARAILTDVTDTERTLLSAFPYQRNVAVLHDDPSALPRCRRAWAAWNHRVRETPHADVSVTYNMTILQRLPTRRAFCVTLNDEAGLDPDRVLGRWVYHHPIFAAGVEAAQRRHAEVIDVNRTSFCGAYWGAGFHEDGVRSAMAVCAKLTATPRACPVAVAAGAAS